MTADRSRRTKYVASYDWCTRRTAACLRVKRSARLIFPQNAFAALGSCCAAGELRRSNYILSPLFRAPIGTAVNHETLNEVPPAGLLGRLSLPLRVFMDVAVRSNFLFFRVFWCLCAVLLRWQLKRRGAASFISFNAGFILR